MMRSAVSLLVLPALLVAGCTQAAPLPPPVPMTPVVPTAGPVPPVAHFATATPAPTPSPTPVVLEGPLTVGLMPGLPEELSMPLLNALNQIDRVEADNGPQPLRVLDEAENATTVIEAVDARAADHVLAERVFAVVVPFETVTDEVALEDLQLRWQGLDERPILADSATAQLLTAVLGPGVGVTVEQGDLLARLEEMPDALGILPFDQLTPRYKVLRVDGVNVLSNRFVAANYPLIAAINVRGPGASLLVELLQPVIEPVTNRDATQLTTLIMTGVTAISRGTAAAIERNYVTYPAAIISGTLAAADITHVSNEVPFLDDCEVANYENNLTLCSHTSYKAILDVIGTDIVGLSGNHVNDFGRDGARESLQFYAEHDVPIYGSGLTAEEACKPLLWEDHGNTFAFFAVLAFGPETAWATDEEPGACHYYDHKDEVLDAVRELADEVDIVAVEFQHQETYDPQPIPVQIEEFREMREAGADIVTGVQSHVPQALEPYGSQDPGGPGIIAYGLGNLFFDQMWSWPTRTELIVRHTIYGGRVLNTEVLTAVLEDFAQPRWTEPEEREDILTRIFNAAPPRPQGVESPFVDEAEDANNGADDAEAVEDDGVTEDTGAAEDGEAGSATPESDDAVDEGAVDDDAVDEGAVDDGEAGEGAGAEAPASETPASETPTPSS